MDDRRECWIGGPEPETWNLDFPLKGEVASLGEGLHRRCLAVKSRMAAWSLKLVASVFGR